jgi:hypothetical protein
MVSPGSFAFWPVVFSILGILSRDNLATHRNQFFLYSRILYKIGVMFISFVNTWHVYNLSKYTLLFKS